MGQIVRRRKKGRPSKADLAGRHSTAASSASQHQPQLPRRSNRRRSFRYNITGYDDDYLDDDDFQVDDDDEGDEDEEEDEEDEHQQRRREKKLKLVLKLPTATTNLNNSTNSRPTHEDGARSVSRPRRPGRKAGESDDEEEEEEDEEEEQDEEEEGSRVVKKRKISGNECDDEEDDEDNCNDEGRRHIGEQKKDDSLPGTPEGHSGRVRPLPDKKRLELILDKLQKKDTYGVFAEPVDPEELPDYHDVIEHPMDFDTIRKKLANGTYPTLEQFESDVFLICSNAMQYNAPETIYHKQARAIKELAEKKFQRVRDDIERCEKETKPEQIPKSEQMIKSEEQSKSNSIVMKQIKKPILRSAQEPVGSDFASGATLATADPQKTSNAVQVGNGERQNNNGGLLEGNSSLLADNAAEKAEEQQSGKGLLPKFGRKSSVVDENRRVTYDPSSQEVDSAESMFTTFEGEKKQLISVGLQGERSYARSLARFAATLGPVAWKFASKRIEQALPPGFKFGRGWVGEYEPLPTPLVFRETRSQKDPFPMKLQSSAECKNDRVLQYSVPSTDHVLPAKGPSLDAKPSLVHSGGSKPPTPKSMISKQQNPLSRESMPRENMNKQQKPLSRDPVPPGDKVGRRVESHCPAIEKQNGDLCTQSLPCVAEISDRPVETITRSNNSLQQFSFKQPESNGSVVPGGVRNGKSIHSSLDINQAIRSPRNISSGGPVVGVTSFTQRQEQGLSDPVQVQKLPNGSNPSFGPLQVTLPPLTSPRGDNRNNAAAAAASVWMSVGAGGFKPAAEKPSINTSRIPVDSLYDTSRDFYPQMLQSRGEVAVSGTMHFPPDKMSLPFQAFVPQPAKASSDMPVQNRPMMFPQLATTDLSRFPVQSPWRGLSPHTQQRQKQDKLPPDLNIAFQSPVDSQQPDLALQL
ncbi:hypothetical protein Dimus_019150 [Dionaea muscipula]